MLLLLLLPPTFYEMTNCYDMRRGFDKAIIGQGWYFCHSILLSVLFLNIEILTKISRLTCPLTFYRLTIMTFCLNIPKNRYKKRHISMNIDQKTCIIIRLLQIFVSTRILSVYLYVTQYTYRVLTCKFSIIIVIIVVVVIHPRYNEMIFSYIFFFFLIYFLCCIKKSTFLCFLPKKKIIQFFLDPSLTYTS